MRKIIFASIIFCLVLLPLKGEIALNLGAVYSGAFSIDNINYRTTWSDNSGIVSFTETNNSNFTGTGGAGFNAGLSFFFNYKMGVGISIATLKTNYKILNSFNWHFQWWNGTAADIQPKEWESEGDLNVLPVNVNVIFRAVSNKITDLLHGIDAFALGDRCKLILSIAVPIRPTFAGLCPFSSIICLL